MKRGIQILETFDDQLGWVQRQAAAHGYDASQARLDQLFKERKLSFTLRGVETPRPGSPELVRLAELLTRAGVRSLSVTE